MLWDKPDWRLVKLKAADNDLLGYERSLLDELFVSHGRPEDAEAVWLSKAAAPGEQQPIQTVVG